MPDFSVFGASGFIGGHLVRHLRRKGHEVLAVSREDKPAYDRPLGHVAFCIGLTTDYWRRPLDAAEAHVCALIPLLRHAQFDSLTYLSSIRLYDHLEGLANEASEIRLNPQNPRNVYDFSKGLGEALAHHAGRPAKVVRLGNVYDDNLNQDDFLCRTVQRAMREPVFELDADPASGRDYIHIDDVCNAVEAVGLSGREPTYNVASGCVFTNQELAVLCERELKCRITFRGSISGSRPPPKVDVGRLRLELNINPRPASGVLPELLSGLAANNNKV